MRRLLAILLPAMILAAVWTASAADFIPVPSFSQHEIPRTQHPVPRPDWREYLDLAALVVALSAASYLAIGNRSRRGLLLLTIGSLAWFGFWRNGCICPIGAIQNVTLALCDDTYAVPLVALGFFIVPLVFTLFFGRTFCAAVCPLGAVQELVAVRPVRVPIWLDQALGLLAYVYLGAGVLFAATGTAFVICRYDPFVGFFRLGASWQMLLFGGCLLLVGWFVGRPYCRYLCPYGAMLRWLSLAAKWHVRIPPENCIQCRLCEDACPYGAIREPTVALPSSGRSGARRRLVFLLLTLPVLVAIGGGLGRELKVPLSRLHPTVRLARQIEAERIEKEQTGEVTNVTDASNNFRAKGGSVEELNAEATALRDRFQTAGGWFGTWVGLVIGAKLIHLSLRRRRTDYQPDRAGCVSCGRCFWYCPCEQSRQGLIELKTDN